MEGVAQVMVHRKAAVSIAHNWMVRSVQRDA